MKFLGISKGGEVNAGGSHGAQNPSKDKSAEGNAGHFPAELGTHPRVLPPAPVHHQMAAHTHLKSGGPCTSQEEMAPAPAFLPAKCHGQRSLAGYSPQGPPRVGHDRATEHPPAGKLWADVDLDNCFILPGV